LKSSNIFGGSWGSIENLLGPKAQTPSEKLACPNPRKALEFLHFEGAFPLGRVFSEFMKYHNAVNESIH